MCPIALILCPILEYSDSDGEIIFKWMERLLKFVKDAAGPPHESATI